jgi:DNA-binding transcriptional LysR family regulator
VDAGSFSRAATQVNVTQPTLSVGIAKLEEALGVRLFLRNSQRVQLTQAGVRLLAGARAIEGEFNALDARISETAERPVLRVGVLSTVPTRLLERVVAAHRARGAASGLQLVEGVERDLVNRLQRGRIDVALTLIRPGEQRFACEALFDEGYAVAVAADHPCAGREQVAAETLAQETMIVRRHCEVLSETSRHFTERGVRPRFSYRSTNDDRALALVRAGLGITVMPESYAAEGEAWPRLAGFGQRRTIGLMLAPGFQAGDGDGLEALRSLRI